MKNIVLVCNAGISTGMLAKKIQQASNGTMTVKAYGEAEYQDYLDGVDMILVGPQIRHLLPDIKKNVSCPVTSIAPQYYGMMNGKAVYKEIVKVLGE